MNDRIISAWLSVSLETRFLVLVATLGTIALVEFLMIGRRARRWRDYLLLIVCGLIGAVVGVGVDQVTVRICQEYFLLGKGLPDGPQFTEELLRLGIHAGFVAGACVAMALLMIDGNKKSGKPIGHLRLLGVLPGIILTAATTAAIGGMIYPHVDFMDLETWADGFLAAERKEAFMRVWGIHAGLYLGALLGLVASGLKIRRLRLVDDRLEADEEAPREDLELTS